MNLYDISRERREAMMLFSTYFTLYSTKTKKYEKVFDLLISHTNPRYSHEVWCVIANISRAVYLSAKSISVPKDRNVYVNNAGKVSYRRLRAVLDSLADNGYLVFHRGGSVYEQGTLYNIQSLYEITEKMRHLFDGINISDRRNDLFNSIVIRNRATKEIMCDKYVRGVLSLKQKMDDYNYCISRARLTWKGESIPPQQYMRIFTDSLKYGGRLYNRVGGIQTMKQEDRKFLSIDGEPVVELDFKALHPSILYELRWQIFPNDVEDAVFIRTDPYDIEMPALDIDQYAIDRHIKENSLEHYNPVRSLTKAAVMICLNAKSLNDAVKALVSELRDDYEKEAARRKYVGIPFGKSDNGLSKFPAKYVCESVQHAHAIIGDCFFADQGINLQRVDSDIICEVLTALTEQNISAFSEHDSIIVKESIAAYAESLMREAYKDVVGSDRFCQIEKK